MLWDKKNKKKMATVTTNLSSHHFSRTMESTDGSMDSNDISNHYSGRESPSIDNNSCCSDDTVLSVGNENPPISENLSFKNIESHLNAISQLTQNTLADVERHSSKSPNSPMSSHRLSPTSTKSISDSPTPSYMYKSDHMSDKSNPTSPLDSSSFISPLFRPLTENPKICVSGPNSPEVRQHQKSPSEQFYFRQTSPMMKPNDNTNQEQNNGSLKFSIDNILKADFGRRITDPINIKKSKPKKIVTSVSSASLKSFDAEPAATAKIAATGAGPVDLSKTDSTENGSTSTLESTKGNSQPMLWPAWVYCTRYSDRPSSGKNPIIYLVFFFILLNKQNIVTMNLELSLIYDVQP